MQLDSDLQDLWQSEPVPSHLGPLMGRVRRHRRWWIARRFIEAGVAIFIAWHYLTHQGSEVGHWLYLPIPLIFFPALWVLIYKNASIARAHAAMGVKAGMQIRIEQIRGAMREVRFMLITAAGLIGYSVSSWWAMRVVGASPDALMSAEGLVASAIAAALVIVAVGLWRRKYYGRELAACTQALHELDREVSE